MNIYVISVVTYEKSQEFPSKHWILWFIIIGCLNLNCIECYFDFSMMLSSCQTIQSSVTELRIHYWNLDLRLSHVNFTENSRSCSVSDCRLIQILYHWINASLLESCEYNKGLHKVAASWSGILTMWQKTDIVWCNCQNLIVHCGLVVIIHWQQNQVSILTIFNNGSGRVWGFCIKRTSLVERS